MTTKQFLLVLIGFLDGTVVGWTVWTSIRNRNISFGMDKGPIDRDQKPVGFWSRIGFLIFVGLAVLATVFWALAEP